MSDLTGRYVWWCEERHEDADSECLDEIDRDERIDVYGDHRDCALKLLADPPEET